MASVGFRWLDILEKEFDKAFVDLDLTIGNNLFSWISIMGLPFPIQLTAS